jgi:hypothetical protein
MLIKTCPQVLVTASFVIVRTENRGGRRGEK